MLSYIRPHQGLISEPYFREQMHWPAGSRSGEELLQTTKMPLDLLTKAGILWNNSDSELQEDIYPKLSKERFRI